MDFEDDYDNFEGFEHDEDFAGVDDAQSVKPMPDESACDSFTATDAFFIGAAMGWAYEEAIDEGRRRSHKRKRRRDADDDFEDDFTDEPCEACFDEEDDLNDEEPSEDSLSGEEGCHDAIFEDDLSIHEISQDEPGAPLAGVYGGLDWEDIAFLGAMSEEIAEERRRRERLIREMDKGRNR